MTSITNRALVVMTVVLAGCAGTQPSTSVPILTPQAPIATTNATPGATEGQSPEVTPTPSEPTSTPAVACEGGEPATAFEPDSIVCVVEGPLRVRSRPNTSEDSVKFEELLQTGHPLFVVDGPSEGSGYDWYLIQTMPPRIFGRVDGWVAAAAKDGTPWLASASVSCPADPSLQELGSMEAVLRIYCYHAREFTFTDTVIAGPNCGDGNVLDSPAWMRDCASTFWWGEPPSNLTLAIPPNLAGNIGEVELPDGRFEATITAHMDDPAAGTCTPYEGVEADYELLNPGTVLACRGMFVATSIQRITP